MFSKQTTQLFFRSNVPSTKQKNDKWKDCTTTREWNEQKKKHKEENQRAWRKTSLLQKRSSWKEKKWSSKLLEKLVVVIISELDERTPGNAYFFPFRLRKNIRRLPGKASTVWKLLDVAKAVAPSGAKTPVDVWKAVVGTATAWKATATKRMIERVFILEDVTREQDSNQRKDDDNWLCFDQRRRPLILCTTTHTWLVRARQKFIGVSGSLAWRLIIAFVCPYVLLEWSFPIHSLPDDSLRRGFFFPLTLREKESGGDGEKWRERERGRERKIRDLDERERERER